MVHAHLRGAAIGCGSAIAFLAFQEWLTAVTEAHMGAEVLCGSLLLLPACSAANGVLLRAWTRQSYSVGLLARVLANPAVYWVCLKLLRDSLAAGTTQVPSTAWPSADLAIAGVLLLILWTACSVGAFCGFALAKRWLATPGVCRQCGYGTQGNVSGTCPECGSRLPQA